MKGLKLSKTAWLILSAGVFLVVLAGLGLTRSQQMKEQTKLGEELALYEKRIGALQTTQLSQQLEILRGKVEENDAQLKDAQARLRQTVISVDVTDEFFKTAEYCSVNITNMSTTVIAQTKYEGITLSTISLNASVVGAKKNIISFVVALNNGYVTGNVESAQIRFTGGTGEEENPEEEDEETGEGDTLETGNAVATVSMLIYSYEGK